MTSLMANLLCLFCMYMWPCVRGDLDCFCFVNSGVPVQLSSACVLFSSCDSVQNVLMRNLLCFCCILGGHVTCGFAFQFLQIISCEFNFLGIYSSNHPRQIGSYGIAIFSTHIFTRNSRRLYHTRQLLSLCLTICLIFYSIQGELHFRICNPF